MVNAISFSLSQIDLSKWKDPTAQTPLQTQLRGEQIAMNRFNYQTRILNLHNCNNKKHCIDMQ